MTPWTTMALDVAAYAFAATFAIVLVVGYVRRVRGERDTDAIRRRLGLDRGR